MTRHIIHTIGDCCQVTNETADLFIEHEEKNNMDMELERMAAELEITVDYLMAEFL